MKDDYAIKGQTVQVTHTLEKEVAEILKKMSEYTRHGESEILNVALKRFIAVHSDFLPVRK